MTSNSALLTDAFSSLRCACGAAKTRTLDGMTAHRAKRKRWMDLIGLLEAMEAGAVTFEDGSPKVIELARDLGIADHHYVRPFYGAPTQPEAVNAEVAGMASAMMRQATPKLLRYARDHAI